MALSVTARWPISSAARGTATRSCSRSMPMVSASRGHPRHGQERLAREPPAAGGGGRERGRAGDEEQHQDAPHRRVDAGERLAHDEDPALPEAVDGGHQRPEVPLAGGFDGGQVRPAGERVRARRGRDDPPRLDPVAVGEQHPPGRVEHGGDRARVRQHGLADVQELLGALRRVAAADLRRGAPQVAVDPVLEVRPQAQHQEGPEHDDDRAEEDRVPRREAHADRQVHDGSRTNPTPRTVRMSRSPDGSSSLRRR